MAVPKFDPPSASFSKLWQQALGVCPPEIEARIRKLPDAVLARVEELRFRVGQPVQMCGMDYDQFLHRDSGLTSAASSGFVVTADHLKCILQAVTQASLYAVEDELRQGYVTMPGGHRVGIAGRAVLYESGEVRSLRNITSVNVRIAREYLGAADSLRPFLYHKSTGKPCSVLLISPPQCGKTTILRDLARQWSEGTVVPGSQGKKVGIVDERSEIAGCLDGFVQFQVGPRTDVLDACPKAQGMLMMIRSLSPDIVVTDEIGRLSDAEAILEAAHAGVAVIASAHAASLDEWRARPHMSALFAARAFGRYVVLNRARGPGTVQQILGSDGAILYTGVMSVKKAAQT